VAGLIMSSNWETSDIRAIVSWLFSSSSACPGTPSTNGQKALFERFDRIIFGAARHDGSVADPPHALAMARHQVPGPFVVETVPVVETDRRSL
jgi:hypothetical protein